MKRPWHVWLIFAICALVVLATMVWFSGHAMDGDMMRQRAERDMQREQQINLALWRMDTKLAPLIAEEAARPHYFYDSFYALDDTLNSKGQPALVNPSPMLFQNSGVRLNFDNSLSTNQWASPQVPEEKFNEVANQYGLTDEQIQENRRRLDQLAKSIDPQDLLARLPKESIPVLSLSRESAGSTDPFQAAVQSQSQTVERETAQVEQVTSTSPEASVEQSANQSPKFQQQIALPQAKFAKGAQQRDYGERGSRFQGLVQQEFNKQRAGNYVGGYANPFNAPDLFDMRQVQESLSKPLWISGELLLAKRIVRDGKEGVQGSWLDWPKLKEELLSEVVDLFPRADLLALESGDEGDPARMLAGLPVELAVPHEKAILLPSKAIRWTLALGWLTLSIALAAVAALLWGVLALSERRAAFVSSVTHELRTPLTTFSMYADMLARDMVPDAEKRKEYLATLQSEAERLTHLVENVLSYARLERGRGPSRGEEIIVESLVEHPWSRLADRAEQSDMQLELHIADDARDLRLSTDIGVVEQILFNLVDNASKYAAEAEDRRITCEVDRLQQYVRIAIRDRGPGFHSKRQAIRPRPFSKSSEEAAVTKPGVGLGLALCKRLASQLGGRLEIHSDSTGARALLFLPI